MTKWSDFLKRCQVFMEPDFKVLYKITQSRKWNNLDELFEIEEVSAERQKEINNVISRMSENREILKLWESLETFLKVNYDDMEKPELYFMAQSLHNKLLDSPYEFIKKLGLVVLAIRSDNEAWAQKELDDFLNFHPARISFEIHRDLFSSKWSRERFEKLMLDIGMVVGNFLKKKNPLKVDIFMTIMDESLSSRTFKSLSSNYQTQWSLSRLRESFSSGQKVSSFPSFWYSQLSHRTSRGQVEVFIDSLFDEKNKDQLDFESLWVFTESMPSDESKRKVIRDIVTSHKSNDPYYRFIALELIEHEAFKRLLTEKRQRWDRPIFQLKRSVYQELFWESAAPELMLFFLLELGDYNNDYLWAFAYPMGQNLE